MESKLHRRSVIRDAASPLSARIGWAVQGHLGAASPKRSWHLRVGELCLQRIPPSELGPGRMEKDIMLQRDQRSRSLNRAFFFFLQIPKGELSS